MFILYIDTDGMMGRLIMAEISTSLHIANKCIYSHFGRYMAPIYENWLIIIILIICILSDDSDLEFVKTVMERHP